MAKIQVKIVMPQKCKFEAMTDNVILPGIEGDFEVLAGHTPFITKLRTGSLYINNDTENHVFAIHDGFVSVEGDKVNILCEACEGKDEIDVPRAEEAKSRAEKRMTHSNEEGVDYRRAEASLRRALTRIQTVSL